ncbi:hypothetical protein ABG067_003623 [Albugo candida]
MNSPPQRRLHLIPRQTKPMLVLSVCSRVRPVPSKPRFRVSAACKDEESQARTAWSDQLYSLQSRSLQVRASSHPSTLKFSNVQLSRMYAAGSFHGTTGLYAEDSGEELMTLCVCKLPRPSVFLT